MPNIQIKGFEIANYRNISTAEIDFSQGVVGLIGANASGKTNVGRALGLFCDLVRDIVPRFGPRQEQVPIKQVGGSISVDPAGILPNAVAGAKVTLSGRLLIPNDVVPDEKDFGFQDIDRKLTHHELLVRIVLTCEEDPSHTLALFHSCEVLIDQHAMAGGAISRLNTLWRQFRAVRLQTLSPVREFFEQLRQLRNSGIAGRNALDRLNKSVKRLDENLTQLDFINNTPMGIEGEISDLSLENMSSGNVDAFRMLSVMTNPNTKDAVCIHIEEPETHFYPRLQRHLVRHLVQSRGPGAPVLIIETHSPEILRELYAQEIPIYRVEIREPDDVRKTRHSEVCALPRGNATSKFLGSLGVDGAFALLGGVVIITDGPTDVLAYREFFSKFSELDDCLLCFVPMGCLESRGLNLTELRRLSQHVILLADGHFLEKESLGERLEAKCTEAGIEYFQLQHWGAENFLTKPALELASKTIPLRIDEHLRLDPMQPLGTTNPGLGFSKDLHMAIVAQHVSREELESERDFMAVVERLERNRSHPGEQ